VLLITI